MGLRIPEMDAAVRIFHLFRELEIEKGEIMG